MSCDENHRLSRRRILQGGTHLALWSLLPCAAIAGTRDPRFLVIILRGGLDGLSLAAPIGDPDYERLRGKLALPKSGQARASPSTVSLRSTPRCHTCTASTRSARR